MIVTDRHPPSVALQVNESKEGESPTNETEDS